MNQNKIWKKVVAVGTVALLVSFVFPIFKTDAQTNSKSDGHEITFEVATISYSLKTMGTTYELKPIEEYTLIKNMPFDVFTDLTQTGDQNVARIKLFLDNVYIGDFTDPGLVWEVLNQKISVAGKYKLGIEIETKDGIKIKTEYNLKVIDNDPPPPVIDKKLPITGTNFLFTIMLCGILAVSYLLTSKYKKLRFIR